VFVIIADELKCTKEDKEVKDLINRCKMEMREASWCPNWYLAAGDPQIKESEKIKEFNKACEVRMNIRF
jgi:hypothetical protein